MAEVIFKNVDKVYAGGVMAVRDFSLEVHDGEFVVLVGPSGCGKSTLLRMLAGLEEITRGAISIAGRVVNDVPPKNRDIAMVFQNYALYPHMTVYENMAFGLKLRKFSKNEIDDRIREAADILGLSELLGRRPRTLSGGQRQRVAVGRAIVRKPAVFLFDEPLSNLDAKLRVQMRVEISRLHNQLGVTVVYVTHDQVEAMTMGERIVVMNEGVIQQVAEPVTLYDKPANRFVAGFIGTPPMNFFDGRIQKLDGDLIFRSEGRATRPEKIGAAGGLVLSLARTGKENLVHYEGKRVMMGIRPEDIGSTAAEKLERAPCIRAVVDVVEPMGSESYVHFVVGGSSFVSRADAHRRFRVGQECELAVFIEKAHFFDCETGERI